MIEIYTKRTCGYCHMAKNLLDAKGIDYSEIDVTFDTATFKQMLEKAEGRRTVPQIFIDNLPIGGFMELAALSQSGQLERILEKQSRKDNEQG